MLLYLKYYADDDFREQWQKDGPKDPIPPHEDRLTTATVGCPSRTTASQLTESRIELNPSG